MAVDDISLTTGAGGGCSDVTLTLNLDNYPEETDWENAIEKTLSGFEKLDILVNNAGITRDGLVAMMKEKDWDDVSREDEKVAEVEEREPLSGIGVHASIHGQGGFEPE